MNKRKWELLKADRSWSNESNGAEMAGCISESGRVVAYLPNHFDDAPLICSAPELLEALESLLEQADLGAVDEETQPIVDKARRAIAKARGL